MDGDDDSRILRVDGGPLEGQGVRIRRTSTIVNLPVQFSGLDQWSHPGGPSVDGGVRHVGLGASSVVASATSLFIGDHLINDSQPKDRNLRSREGLRTKDKLLLLGYAVAVIGLVFPLVPGVWSGEPSWIALPISFAWVLGLLAWVFVLVLVHFLTEAK